jgi:hypothetical protein
MYVYIARLILLIHVEDPKPVKRSSLPDSSLSKANILRFLRLP